MLYVGFQRKKGFYRHASLALNINNSKVFKVHQYAAYMYFQTGSMYQSDRKYKGRLDVHKNSTRTLY